MPTASEFSEGNELIFLVEEDSESGYEAQAVGENIFTQGKTIAEIREMIRDAVDCHYDNPTDRPRLIQLVHS